MTFSVNQNARAAIQQTFDTKEQIPILIPIAGSLKAMDQVDKINKIKYYLLDNLFNEETISFFKSLECLPLSKDVKFMGDKFVEKYEQTIQTLIKELISVQMGCHAVGIMQNLAICAVSATALVIAILGIHIFSSDPSLCQWPLAVAGGIGFGIRNIEHHFNMMTTFGRERRILNTLGVRGYNDRLKRKENYKNLFGAQPFIIPHVFDEKVAEGIGRYSFFESMFELP